MTDIQKARDVLKKWRDGDVLLWHSDEHGTVLDSTGAAVVIGATEGDARLIVGTAGNPDLLDAIDVWLAEAQQSLAEIEASDSHALAALMRYTGGGRHKHALHVAAAILDADERMQQ